MNAKISGVEAGAHYFQHCRSLGFSDPEVINELVKAGWSQNDINAAMMIAAEPVTQGHSNRWLWIILGAIVFALVAAVSVVGYLVATGQLN